MSVLLRHKMPGGEGEEKGNGEMARGENLMGSGGNEIETSLHPRDPLEYYFAYVFLNEIGLMGEEKLTL